MATSSRWGRRFAQRHMWSRRDYAESVVSTPERRTGRVITVMPERKCASGALDSRAGAQTYGGSTVIGVSVTFQYDEDFDRSRVVSIAENARGTFEAMPGLRSKVFTVDATRQRAMNFYVWESADAAKSFFSEEMRERVTGLYGVEPTIDFVEIAQLVDNSGASHQE